MIPRFKSILSRIIWLHVLAIGMAAIATPLATYFLLSATATSFENQMLRAHAATIGNYLTVSGDGQWKLDLPVDLVTFYVRNFDGFAYSVVDYSNNVLFSSQLERAQRFGDADRRNSPSYFHRQTGNSAYYGASFPVMRDGRTVWVQVTQDLEHPDVIVDDIVADYLARVAWFTIPIMVLLLVCDIFVVRRALRPVTRASAMARSINPERMDIRLPVDDVPDEVLPLVDAMNQAMSRLEKAFRLQREFTADAAHELRTPLAVLRARVETLPDQQSVAVLRNDLEAMTRTVDGLLEVAEFEAASVDLKETVDLRGVCADVAAGLAPIAIAQNKEVALTGSETPKRVRGNAAMLHQAIRNLAENALRHTPVGTTVEINVSDNGDVSVLDEGPGVSTDERELIFRRFWRRDRRSTSGAGLGLAIVARIVEAHAGKIEVKHRPMGGAIFSVSLRTSD